MGGSMGLALWFAGGSAFFAGAALIVAAAVPKGLSSSKAARVTSRMRSSWSNTRRAIGHAAAVVGLCRVGSAGRALPHRA